jgi:translation elongation factor EF-4
MFEGRLRREHGGSLITTAPTVPYMIRSKDGKEAIISNPLEFPSGDHDFKQIEYLESYVLATITMPEEYLGKVIEL